MKARAILAALVTTILMATLAYAGSFSSGIRGGGGVATALDDLTDVVVTGAGDTGKYLESAYPSYSFEDPPLSTAIMQGCADLKEVGGLGMLGTETEMFFDSHAYVGSFSATRCWCVGGAGCTDGTPGSGATVVVEECDNSGQNCTTSGSACPGCDVNRTGVCDQDGASLTQVGDVNVGETIRVSVTSVNPTISNVVVCNQILYDF